MKNQTMFVLRIIVVWKLFSKTFSTSVSSTDTDILLTYYSDWVWLQKSGVNIFTKYFIVLAYFYFLSLEWFPFLPAAIICVQYLTYDLKNQIYQLMVCNILCEIL